MALIVRPRIATAQNQSPARSKTEPRRQIVFVCEQGAALSAVAATYFNRLAKHQHLNLHAVARGTAPQQNIASSAEKGFRGEGVPFETKRPQALSTIDGVRALLIVAFCPIPEEYSKIATVETWNDVPPTGVDYAAARDAILKHLKELMSGLSQTEKTQ